MPFTLVWSTWALCVGLSLGFGIDPSDIAVCQRPWVEQHKFSSTSAVTPPRQDLRTDILHGKPVRVTVTQGEAVESFLLDNVNMNTGVICGETLERMTSPLTPTSDLLPTIVCTDGYAATLNVSAAGWEGNSVATEWKVTSLSFMTRDIHPTKEPLISHYLDGSHINNNKPLVAKAAFKSEMRGVMRDRGYSFSMDNTHFDYMSGHLNGQSLSHVSQAYPNSGEINFRENPYYWLSSWDTSGRRDSTRFSVGDMQGLRHTNDFVALQWFCDVCWTTVYVHDATGSRLDGSIDMLKMYIRMGHRVRVHFNGYSLEANSVLISPDDVIVAQTSGEMARRGGFGTDKTFFNTKTRRVYRLVHSTGLIQSLWYFIQNGKLSAKDTSMHKVMWSVDTRPWNPSLKVNGSYSVTFGDLSRLLTSVKTENVRVKVELQEKAYKGQKTSELYYEINNIRCPNTSLTEPEVIGQSLKTVPYYRKTSSYTMHLYSPVTQYVEISTQTGVSITHFSMDDRDHVVTKELPVEAITWFTDAAIQGELLM